MKVLIITPSFNLVGGVSNHYLGLKDFWSCKAYHEHYGKRKKIPAILTLPFDLMKYIIKLIFIRPDLVIINPSLRKYQLIRDGIYLLIARIFGCRVITFFHGWNDDLGKKLTQKVGLFQKVYNKSTLIFVLSKSFIEQLIESKITVPISLTTTKVNDQLLKNFSINTRDGKVDEILFLGRIVKEKGIFIALESFGELKKKYPHLKMRVVGSGEDLIKAKKYVEQSSLTDIQFTGPVFNDEIAKHFEACQLYILPTESEGMATSVLEAMSFGMPILTTPVGGINDYFIHEKMGRLIENNVSEYIECIEYYINNPRIVSQVAHFNYKYATTHFLASNVCKKLEMHFEDTIIRTAAQ